MLRPQAITKIALTLDIVLMLCPGKSGGQFFRFFKQVYNFCTVHNITYSLDKNKNHESQFQRKAESFHVLISCVKPPQFSF